MKERKFTLFAKNIIERDFCGQTIWEYEIDGVYEPPFETEPTKGNHDFNTCEVCKEVRKVALNDLTERFTKQDFPYCCEPHKKLLALQEFKKSHFKSIPEIVTNKVIYTKQHIINNIGSDNYYKEITDYIEYTIESFGKMPEGYGPRLYLSDYFLNVIEVFKYSLEEGKVPKERSIKILKFLEAYSSPNNRSQTDLNILFNTYNKWFKIFPFEISFFAHLKPYYQMNWLPIVSGEPEYNPYLAMVKVKFHTKDRLVDILLELTNDIITKINSTSLYEQGKLTEPQKVKIELILSERKTKLKQGYINKAKDEDMRFRKILKEWYKDEKEFIDKINPLLKELSQIEINAKTSYKEKIGQGQIKKVIEELIEENKVDNENVYNELIQLSSRYNNNEKDLDMGLIKNDEANINRNSISKALINLIDELK